MSKVTMANCLMAFIRTVHSTAVYSGTTWALVIRNTRWQSFATPGTSLRCRAMTCWTILLLAARTLLRRTMAIEASAEAVTLRSVL